MLVFERILSVLIGYACGLIQTGFLVGRANKMDIREHGSGNSGSTNALRTMGLKAGVITFVGDFLKAALAVLIVRSVFGFSHPDYKMILGLYAGLGVVLGHDFPFYLNFKGGKGIASTAGLFLIVDWRIAVIPIMVFIIIAFFTKYVSLGSITSMIIVGMEIFLFGSMNGLKCPTDRLWEVYILTLMIVLMALWRHKDNIKRLLKGQENPYNSSKNEVKK